MRLRSAAASIAIVLVSGVSACGSDDPDDEEPRTTETPTTLQPSGNEGRPVNPGVTSGGATGNNPPPANAGTQPPGGNAGVDDSTSSTTR